MVFVVTTFRPVVAHTWHPAVAVVQQAPTTGPLPTAVHMGSYHEAVQRAAPSVVNIFTSKEIRSPRHPLLNDPTFRRFFGDQLPDESQRASSLGSGVIVSATGFAITNHHVVEAADEIEVALADGKLLAKVVGNDPEPISPCCASTPTCPRSPSALPTRSRWVTWCSRSAIRSPWARR